ncbi:helix-turn-helix transcriptional regulator [Archangium violaceum]|uniref:winged helix-turn-helix transcriptional regulator n=1 Tax=Archangium violaceum TaxID=83451 RepID=UPI002B2F33D7|nr:helix-turn-helix transcriptional regulator [Archangium violaceum]
MNTPAPKASVTEANPLPEPCPLVEFVTLVSGKWAIPLLYRLIINGGPVRFRELQRAARPITQKELTKQLRLLETRGLVLRTVYPEMPPRVEYEATHVARQLLGALESIAAWMRTHGRSLRSETSAAPGQTASSK